jgi:hypothetical protein
MHKVQEQFIDRRSENICRLVAMEALRRKER